MELFNTIKRAFLTSAFICATSIILAQTPGDRDLSFAIGTGPSQTVNVVDIMPNGDIFVAGDFTQFNGSARPRLAMLQPNGTPVATFSANTSLGANLAIRSGMIESSGTILIGGIFSTVNGTTRNWFARLQPDGQLVNSFPLGGGPNNEVTAIHSNGARIVISGFFSNYSSNARSGFAVLYPNGALDTTFVNPSWSFSIRSQYVLPNNKILVGGNFSSANGAPINRISRLNANGSIDTSFNPGLGASGPVECISVQADGKILIGGSFTSVNGQSHPRIARLNANGSLDNTFNAGLGFNSTVRGIAIQTNGKIIVTGGFSQFNGQSASFIVRLNPDGTSDTTFDVGTGFNGSTAKAAIQADGRIIVGGGFSQYKSQAVSRLIRLWGDTCNANITPIFSQPYYTSTCIGDTVTIQITGGNLGSSPYWEWFNGSCNGSLIDTGSTLHFTSLADTTTLFVKGLGACNCTPINIFTFDTIAPVPNVAQLPDIESYCAVEVNQMPTATDNCAGTITAVTNDTLFYNQAGNYTITWNYDDGHGNTSNQLQQVKIYTIDTGITALGNNQWQANHTSSTAKYQWGVCIFGQFVSTANDTFRVFTLPNTAEIAVIITEGDCSDTSRCYFLFTNSIEEKFNQKVNVFPNPTDGLFEVESLNPWQCLEIMDVTGKSLHVEKSFAKKIEIQHLPAGVYLVKVIFKEGVGITQLVKL